MDITTILPALNAVLPGLYVTALMAASLWAVRRWFDPLPWRSGVVLALLPLAWFAPILFGDELLLPLDGLRGQPPFLAVPPTDPHGNPLQGDLLSLIAPLQHAVRAAYGAGEWPLWNPSVGAGMPLLADPQAQALQPLTALVAPFPLERAAGMLCVLRMWLALVGMTLFLRRQGVGEAAALLGGLGYGLGGFVQLWLGWPLATAAALLPLQLYAVGLVADRGAPRDSLLLALITVATLAAGQPEGTLYVLACAALYLGCRLRLLHRLGREVRERFLLRTGGALLVAAGLAAPFLVPTFLYLPQTERAADRRAAAVVAAPSWLDKTRLRLTPIFAPNAFGNSRYGDDSGISYWGEQNSNEDAAGFTGTILLLAAAAGIGVRRRFPQERLAWVLLGGAALVLVLPPVAMSALRGIPFWQFSASGHHRVLLVVSFCIAWLGACGVERWCRGEPSRGWLVAGAAALALALFWATWAHVHPAHPQALAVLRQGSLLLQLKVLVAGTLALAALARVRWGAALLGVLVACELAMLHRPANPAVAAARWLPNPASLATLRQVLGDDRIVALGSAFPANLPGLWEIADARVYNPAAPAAYRRLVRPLMDEREGTRTFVSRDHPLYDLLGVRFLLTAADTPPLPRSLRILQNSEATLHERQDALPLLFLPPSWVLATLSWEELATRRASYASRAWLYGAPPTLEAGHGTRGELVARVHGPARLRAGASVPAMRVFATRIFQEGGWHLLVNGEPRRSFLANGPLLAGGLDPHDRVVDLLYRPPGFLFGALLAALAAAAAFAWWAPAPPRDAWLGRPTPIDEGGLG
jgi:hypothetical protein